MEKVLLTAEDLLENEQPLPAVGDFWVKNKRRYVVTRVYKLAAGGYGIFLEKVR